MKFAASPTGTRFAFDFASLRTRSLGVATVCHAAYDGFRDSLSTWVGLGPFGGVFGIIVVHIVGIVLLCKGRWESSPPS